MKVVEGNVEAQENLCFIGGIPVITKFASKKYPYDIRIEAAFFVRMLCQSSAVVLQMFLSCRGLNVLVEFLEEDYEIQKDLVWIGINGVWSIFEAQVYKIIIFRFDILISRALLLKAIFAGYLQKVELWILFLLLCIMY